MSPHPADARDACYPARFDDARFVAAIGDPALRRLVDWFSSQGLALLKAEDRGEAWYADWIGFQAEHGIYASLLSPARWSARGHRLDLRRLARFLEVFAYFSPAHAYSLHVSFLGLFPILSGPNDALKAEAVARLEAGGLFAFGVSEKAHGSDLFGNEFTIRRTAPGRWSADGAKHYIGNANAAAMVSVLARVAPEPGGGPEARAPFAFVAIRPQETTAYRRVEKIRTLGIRRAFVGSFEVRGHELPERDIISSGREAWDAMFRTVDLGKLLLGFGAVGMCEHAFAEALHHLRGRMLYGAPASSMPHLRTTLALAFARLTAMKSYAERALDHVCVASAEDRRYLLLHAVQKARVGTEGVKVMALLQEAVGARGVESETYLESALRDAQLIPGLEGSTHINYALAAQFAGPYFAGPRPGDAAPGVPPPAGESGPENPYWTASRNRNARTVRFAAHDAAYGPLLGIPNVALFARQVEAFRRYAVGASDAAPVGAARSSIEGELAIALGRGLACIVYGQLVAEHLQAVAAPRALVSLIFHTLVEDVSVEALRLCAVRATHGRAIPRLRRAVLVPRTSREELDAVDAFIVARHAP